MEHLAASDPPLATTRRGLAVKATQCAMDYCVKQSKSRGLCAMHHARLIRHGDPTVCLLEQGTSEESRFNKYTDRSVESGCWVWIGARSPAGYGRIRIASRDGAVGRQIYAHRWSYEHHTGPIPVGLLVMHACDNPPCVNPAHLSVGTHRDNAQDMLRKGRARNTPKVNA